MKLNDFYGSAQENFRLPEAILLRDYRIVI